MNEKVERVDNSGKVLVRHASYLHSSWFALPPNSFPLVSMNRHRRRQVEGWSLLAWILVIGWWLVPTVLVAAFFYVSIKYTWVILAWLYDYMLRR